MCDYEVDPAEWQAVSTDIVPFRFTGDAERGWELEFTSLFGWMHECNQLVRHRHVIAPDFEVTLNSTLLSKRIFRRVPSIIY